MSLGLGVLGCGSVFAGPYRGMIERLRADGRVHVARGVRRRRTQAPRRRRALRDRPRSRRPGRGDRPRRRRRRPRPDEHERARPAGEAPRSRPASTCSSRSRWRPRSRRRPSSSSSPSAPRDCSSARRTSCSARPSAPSTRPCARARSGACSTRVPATAGPARTGASGSTGRAAARSSTSASTTSRALCALFGPARRVTAMVGVAIPEREVERPLDPRRGGRQRAGAARLRRWPLRLRHDRLHDAEVPLARDRALRQRGHDPAPRRRLGARGLGAVAERGRRRGASSPRATRTGSGRRGCATSSTASRLAGRRSRRPEHAFHALEIMLAAQAAGRDGIARAIESGLPRSRLRGRVALCRARPLRSRPPEPRRAISRRPGRPSTRRPCCAPTRSSGTRGATRTPASSRTGSTSPRS